MSYVEPEESGYTPHPSEIDPKKFAVCPSDPTQDLVFRSIRAISRQALEPVGDVPVRRTPRGVRPAVFIDYNASKTAVVFEVLLHTNQTVRANVPLDSWRMGTCNPENVRAAVQKAYLYLLQGKDEPIVVKPNLQSLGLVPLSPSPQQYVQRSNSHGSRHTTTSYFISSAPQHQYHNSYHSYSSDSTAAGKYSLVRSSAPTSPTGYYDPYRGAVPLQYIPAGPTPAPRPVTKLKKRSLW